MRRSLILFAALFLVACDGGIFVRGVVRDPAGNPMSGVRVFLERMDERRFEGKTDAAGCFHLGGTAAPGRYDFNFVVEADGFGVRLRRGPNSGGDPVGGPARAKRLGGEELDPKDLLLLLDSLPVRTPPSDAGPPPSGSSSAPSGSTTFP